MARKKNQARRLYWQDVLRRQARSGLSIRKFCAKERVSEPSFYSWRRELGSEAMAVTSQTSGRPQQSGNGHGFVSLEVIESTGALEVIHPHGCQVRITGEVNTAALRQILDVLDERGQE